MIIAAAGWLYELFSHGVYSDYMVYAFMVPLLGGALPDLLAARASRKRASRGSGTGSAPMLQLAAVVTLTAGSIAKGILDIYGTTNRLLIVYPVMAVLLAAAWAAAALLRSSHTAENS